MPQPATRRLSAALPGVLILLLMLPCLLQSAFGLANLGPEVTDPANFLPPRILVRAETTTVVGSRRAQTLDRQAIASALPEWLNREPLGEDESLNLHAYCHNDPVNRIDVQGLEERVIAGTKPVFAEDPSNKDFVFMGFPLEEDGWFRPFQPNGKHSFIPMVMSKEAAMQHLQNPESLNRLRSAAGGYLNEAHAHAKVFYIDNSVGLVGGVGEMTAGIAAAPESAGVSMVATVHGFDVASTRWQRLWAGPESDIQSGTSQLLQLIPGVDRGTAEIGDNLISLATAGSSMYVMGKAPLVYTPRLYSPAAKGGVQYGTTGDAFLTYASRATQPTGMMDVAVHGAPMHVQIGAGTANHRVLANLISRNAEYTGQPIRLLSCETGSLPNGFAQNLSNKLGVPVHAPSDIIWASPSGRLTIGPTPGSNSGSFVPFVPGGNR